MLELVLQDDFSTLVPLVEIPLEFDIGRVLQYFESIKILSVDFKDTVIPSPPVTYSSVVNKANLKHLVYVQLGQVPIFLRNNFRMHIDASFVAPDQLTVRMISKHNPTVFNYN